MHMDNLKYFRIYIFEYIKFGRTNIQAFHLSFVIELLRYIRSYTEFKNVIILLNNLLMHNDARDINTAYSNALEVTTYN